MTGAPVIYCDRNPDSCGWENLLLIERIALVGATVLVAVAALLLVAVLVKYLRDS